VGVVLPLGAGPSVITPTRTAAARGHGGGSGSAVGGVGCRRHHGAPTGFQCTPAVSPPSRAAPRLPPGPGPPAGLPQGAAAACGLVLRGAGP